MPYPPHEQGLRQKAFPWLPGSDFDDALEEARRYHEEHPPLEEGLIRDTTAPLPEDGQHRQGMVDQINRNTTDKLVNEHVEKAMQPFLTRLVPRELAREIVETLLLKA